MADQLREPFPLALRVSNWHEHDEQFIQARSQELGEARCDSGFVSRDDQAVDEGIRQRSIRGHGETCVGEHVDIEGKLSVLTELFARCR